jgi:hypothetical protein
MAHLAKVGVVVHHEILRFSYERKERAGYLVTYRIAHDEHEVFKLS